jgi:sortase A
MRSGFFTACVWVLIASGTFLFTSGLLDYVESRSAQREIAQEWVSAPILPVPTPAATPAAGPRPVRVHSGTAVARLTIPRLNAALYIVEGTDDRDLKRGPGHLTGSVFPGDAGNCVIAGHRDTHFSVLKNIQDGDEVVLERGGHTFHYRVDGMQIVTPDNTESLQPTKDAVLTLITCYPFHYVGAAPKRFIVHAALEDSTLTSAR